MLVRRQWLECNNAQLCLRVDYVCEWRSPGAFFFFCHKRTFIWVLVHLWPAGCQSFLSKHVCSASRDSFPDLERWLCITVNTRRNMKRLIYMERKQQRWARLWLPESCKGIWSVLILIVLDVSNGSGDQACSWPSLSGTTCSVCQANPISNSLPAIYNNGNN